MANRFSGKLGGVPYDNKFIFSEIGYNFLPLEISAAFALIQLKKFPKFLALRRRHFAAMFKFAQKHSKYFDLPKQTPYTKTAWLAFPLVIKGGAPFTRLEIVTFLENRGHPDPAGVYRQHFKTTGF